MWSCPSPVLALVAGGEEVKRVGLREEGVADVALRRWRMVFKLGKYATTRVAVGV